MIEKQKTTAPQYALDEIWMFLIPNCYIYFKYLSSQAIC